MSNEEAREELKDIIISIFKMPRIKDAIFDIFLSQCSNNLVDVLQQTNDGISEVELLEGLRSEMQTPEDVKEFVDRILAQIMGLTLPEEYFEDLKDISRKLHNGEYYEES